jgi:hypothetical protein
MSQSASGVVSLFIVQDQPWSNHPKELESLLRKVENYVRYVTGGALTKQHPQLAGHPWRIVIDTYFGVPGGATLEELRRLARTLPSGADGIVLHELKPPTGSGGKPRSLRARRLGEDGDELVTL